MSSDEVCLKNKTEQNKKKIETITISPCLKKYVSQHFWEKNLF